jgi:lipopolysaccharide transport system permease protein
MLEDVKELWRYRELLGIMVQRELRVRYKGSAIGFLWSFLTPLATTVVVTIVFSVFLKNGIHSYSAYYLSAFLPFMFVQSAILDSSQSVLSALPVVKKIYFPRELLPISNVISNFIHLVLGFLVFFLYLLFVYIRTPLEFPLQASAIWLPFLLIVTLMLGMGLSFFASAYNTFYEDVKHLVSVVLYLMFFMCPIMYFVEQVANSKINRAPYFWVYKLYLLNPIASLCIAYRKILLAPPPIPAPEGKFYPNQPLEWQYLAATTIFSLVVLIWGYATFNRLKWKFVERP